MSVKVMAWVWQHSKAKPTQRLVLLAIADCANDRGRDAYPSNASLVHKTGLSERGVRKAIAELEALGELAVNYKSGPHGCNRYRVIMANPAHDAGSGGSESTRHNVPRPRLTRHDMPGNVNDAHPAPHAGDPAPRAADPAPHSENPAPGAPEPSEPSEPSKNRPYARARAREPRGTRLPDNFEPTPELIAWARQNAPTVGRADHEQFVDYWRSTPGQRGRKLDWPATWRNWMRREHQRRTSNHRPRDSPRESTSDRRVADALAAGARFQAELDQPQPEITP